ncbi:uncharacterized protein LOC144634615 [Oculina patagonica]
MAMSGITANEEIIQKFNEMKLKKKYGYIIMSIKDKKEVVIEEIGDKFPEDCTPKENEEAYNKLKDRLVACEAEPKYVLFDFRIETKDGKREKLAFINWCSDNCHISRKTLQGSTAEYLKKMFQGLSGSIQANDSDELSYTDIVKDLMSGKK